LYFVSSGTDLRLDLSPVLPGKADSQSICLSGDPGGHHYLDRASLPLQTPKTRPISKKLIGKFNLKPHTECGFFVETEHHLIPFLLHSQLASPRLQKLEPNDPFSIPSFGIYRQRYLTCLRPVVRKNVSIEIRGSLCIC